MSRSASRRWANAVVQHSGWIVIGWLVLAIGLRLLSPAWNDVALDGDFDYLPKEMDSVAGERLLDEAFPGDRSRSQIVLVLARDEQSSEKLYKSDTIVGLDLIRRLYHRLGEVSWRRAMDLGYQSGPIVPTHPSAPWLALAQEAFDTSIEADEAFYERIAEEVPDRQPTLTEPRMAIAYWDRGKLLESLQGDEEAIERDFEAALTLHENIPTRVEDISERSLKPWRSLLDILSWQDPVIGSRLTTPLAHLAVLQLSSELAATENIATVEAVGDLLDQVKRYSNHYTRPGLQLEMTGSAAVGGETLLAAREAIRYTEWITVVMILVILGAVYRAPLLVIVPMFSIGIAVLVSTSLVSLLTDWSSRELIRGLDLRIFTTSRIFVVVILFGAGTDYCLFLISRLREEMYRMPWALACRESLSGVMGALIGSAMTTVVGLGMLWIARFGKFHYTGPIIAICLLVGLLVSISLTPAILRLLGPIAFWPTRIQPAPSTVPSLLGEKRSELPRGELWSMIALWLTRRPFLTLTAGISVLLIPAYYGRQHEMEVTYDLSSQLSHSAKSRVGLRLLSQHFEIGEINPVTLLLVQPQETPRKELNNRVKELAKQLYRQAGVLTVRTADDPLGDFSPDREMGLLSGDAWKRRALRNHRVAKRYFFSSIPKFEDRLARIDLVIDGDPFSTESADHVIAIGRFLASEVQREGSELQGAKVHLTGTTPSIIDLRSVTLSDNRRIKIAVVVAVFLVLLAVIRRWLLCLYLIATVLLSYYATLGLTILFFRYAYGDDYGGLDWKLPLFLFVILVAIGQDYNVYLVTRIVEEERRLGWVAALRRAVSRTGGIITACGLVMAATFFSMTASAWMPAIATVLGWNLPGNDVALRGIVELGFALALGVLIDTFYVRSILVPSFVAAMNQRRLLSRRRQGHRPSLKESS